MASRRSGFCSLLSGVNGEGCATFARQSVISLASLSSEVVRGGRRATRDLVLSKSEAAMTSAGGRPGPDLYSGLLSWSSQADACAASQFQGWLAVPPVVATVELVISGGGANDVFPARVRSV